MENKGDKKRGHQCGMFCSCGEMSWGHIILKIVFGVIILTLIFIIVMSYCYKYGVGEKMQNGKFGMMGQKVEWRGEAGNKFYATVGQGRVVGYAGGRGMVAAQPAMVRMFGVVTKIEANLITIMNNGAVEQVVVSQADTIITSSSTEVGLAAVKAGQNIIVVGEMNKDKQLVAKIINIQ